MSQTTDKQIYFHVGLGKTASTYLQHKVFPFFKNIHFIHRKHDYSRAVETIAKAKFERYLISREFDQQLEREVSKFAEHYPATTAIIVFRRQDAWIASQYRRFVKNGHTLPFSEFIDLQNDKGKFKQIDLNFSHKLEVLEKYFTKKPLVLFYDDLRKNPMAFFDYIAKSIGADYDKNDISLDKKHSSYNEKQLKGIMRVAKIVNIQKKTIKPKLLHLFRKLFVNTTRYSTLFISKYLPESWFSNEPLINTDELKAVHDFYESDWQAVIEYAKRNNP